MNIRVIPQSVPSTVAEHYKNNWQLLLKNQRMHIAVADKITHLNALFHGEDIPQECNNPEHLFSVCGTKDISGMITHLGLLARYGAAHTETSYVIQLNGNTVLSTDEPIAKTLHSVRDVVSFSKHSSNTIVGVSYTIFLGSEHEPSMLAAAAQHIMHAHEHGLLGIITIYPPSLHDHESDGSVIAGGCGIANALGADIVICPVPQGKSAAQRATNLKEAVTAAGNTRVIAFDMIKREPEEFLQEAQALCSISGVSGVATDHVLFQQTKNDAISLCEKLTHTW